MTMFLMVSPNLEGDEGSVGVSDIVQLSADLPAHGHLVIQAQTIHTSRT